MYGLFVSFEGTDGCGKSTQIRLLREYLEETGFHVVCTREPGGTTIGEEVRTLLLDRQNNEMEPFAEALLYAAARAQHVRQFILPALQHGSIILCDRFIDSSLAYQGFGRNLGLDEVLSINEYALGGVMPDRTFFLDVPPTAAFDRRSEKGSRDRIEDAGDLFYRRVYEGFLTLCERYPQRLIRIDASGEKAQTQQLLRAGMDQLLRDRGIFDA